MALRPEVERLGGGAGRDRRHDLVELAGFELPLKLRRVLRERRRRSQQCDDERGLESSRHGPPPRRLYGGGVAAEN